jgi:peroxiredoxin
MTLRDELNARREESHNRAADIRAAYAAVVETLSKADLASRALHVGDAMPPFMLPNAEGKLIASDELLARGPLVLTFFRGEWCPYCALTLAALERQLPAIEAASATLVAVTPDSGGRALATKRREGLHYEVLVDMDNGIGLQFGIVFRTPELYRQVLLARGIDLGARHGNAGWFLPIPATYVIDPTATIRYAHIDPDFTHRAEPSEIVAVVQKVSGEKS